MGRDLSCGHRPVTFHTGPPRGPRRREDRAGGVRAGWTPRPHPTARACVTSKHGVTQPCSSSSFTPGSPSLLLSSLGAPAEERAAFRARTLTGMHSSPQTLLSAALLGPLRASAELPSAVFRY